MFGLNVTSDVRKDQRPSPREILSGLRALAARFGGSGRGLFVAASLGAGVIGGLVPAALSAHSRSADAASLSRAVEKLQKLESEQTADAEVVVTVAQANVTLQARLDTLERRLGKLERVNLDQSPTGAVPSPQPAKPDSKRKPSKS